MIFVVNALGYEKIDPITRENLEECIWKSSLLVRLLFVHIQAYIIQAFHSISLRG
jgi:hypothetical protein